MRNTGKPRKEGTQIKAEVTHPVNRQNCSGDTNHEEAFNPSRWFLIYLHRKGYDLANWLSSEGRASRPVAMFINSGARLTQSP